ncbi:endothelin-converting enzyme 1 [Petromyzon marinus]|uniref:Endothelin-converting enzyme 1-like n=1 Tax=Petromyzon marinus TaxID=7757 RepID=A0A1D8H2U3_PETMA|nr:endothelin-converting enzyme 1-like [Petromyzon marinus]AOT86838.1 putative endothelin-converting enzyme C [Petromyzon marinus]
MDPFRRAAQEELDERPLTMDEDDDEEDEQEDEEMRSDLAGPAVRGSYSRVEPQLSLSDPQARPEEGDDAARVVDGTRSVLSLKAVRALLGLVAVLAIAFAGVLAALVVNIKGKVPPPVCLTDVCVNDARLMLNSMDPTVEPCQDFYAYACGAWQPNERLPGGTASWNQRNITWNGNLKFLRDILENATFSADQSSNTDAQTFYRACMNQGRIAEQGAQPLRDLMDGLGGWIPTPNKTTNLTELLTNTTLNFLLPALFSAQVVQSGSKDKLFLELSPPELGLPSEYLTSNATQQALKVRAMYLHYMVRSAVLLGQSLGDAQQHMQKVLSFESTLATIVARTRDSAEPSEVTLDRLQAIAPFINWQAYLHNGIPSGFPQSAGLLVSSTAYFGNLTTLLNHTDATVVSGYVLWRLVQAMSPAMDDSFSTPHRLLQDAVVNAQTNYSAARWEFCMEKTNWAMPYALGDIFFFATRNEQTTDDVKEVINNVRVSFQNTLTTLTWMDNKTRDDARDKASEMKPLVGAENKFSDPGWINSFYAQITPDESSFFDTMVNYYKYLAKRSLEQLSLGLNTNCNLLPPQEVDSRYLYTDNRNKLFVPMGILQPPFYYLQQKRYLQYGAIGSVIAREFLHGFYGEGSQYDASGVHKLWWSNATWKKFEERARCLEHQYGNYSSGGLNVNGTRTLVENVADNGGLDTALHAYEDWITKNREEPQLPFLGLNARQTFFVSFAQSLCSAETPEHLRETLATAPTSPSRFRVLGALSNSPEFAKAFTCPQGSAMNTGKKCRVW